jgi:hypothetical protein
MLTSTMQSLNEDERRAVLGEVLADQLKAILEYVSEIPGIKNRLEGIETRLSNVENILTMHDEDIRYLRQHLA